MILLVHVESIYVDIKNFVQISETATTFSSSVSGAIFRGYFLSFCFAIRRLLFLKS